MHKDNLPQTSVNQKLSVLNALIQYNIVQHNIIQNGVRKQRMATNSLYNDISKSAILPRQNNSIKETYLPDVHLSQIICIEIKIKPSKFCECKMIPLGIQTTYFLNVIILLNKSL